MVYAQLLPFVCESKVLTESVAQDIQLGFVEQVGIKGKTFTEVIQQMKVWGKSGKY